MNDGLLLVNKPCGISSFDVVRRVRRLCGTRQVGHCGTLDPAASGVLPVAFGSATRLVEYLMAGDKEYLGTLQLGIVTDTQDGEGTVLAVKPFDGITRADVEAASRAFLGVISQVPPMYSALKRDGVTLYRLARQGVEVERAPRQVRIDAIEIVAFEPPRVTLRVACSKGTYIRTLCHDLGLMLGCGGHMAALCRTRCGSFTLAESHPLEQLEALSAAGLPLPVISLAAALPELPAVQVDPAARARLANGVAPSVAEVSAGAELAANALVRLMADDRLAAIARYVPGGAGGRPGDFVLDKVFPDSFRSA